MSVITDYEAIAVIAEKVRWVYRSLLKRDVKQDEAYENAAADLGISGSKVKRFLTADMFKVSRVDAEAIHDGYIAAKRSLRDWYLTRAMQLERELAEERAADIDAERQWREAGAPGRGAR